MRQITLDTETTGLDVSNGHRVIEIGCTEIIDRKFTGNELHFYLNPERDIDPGAVAVHGLSKEFLSDKPFFSDIAEDLLTFLEDAEVLMHNAEFDLGFLNNEINILQSDYPAIETVSSNIVDTLQLARAMHPGQRNSLEVLTDRYQITGYDRSYHGALIDSEILADVYLAMTGGQRDLGFDENTSRELQSNSSDSASNDFNLVSIEISKDDADKHEIYLNSLSTDSHGNN